MGEEPSDLAKVWAVVCLRTFMDGKAHLDSVVAQAKQDWRMEEKVVLAALERLKGSGHVEGDCRMVEAMWRVALPEKRVPQQRVLF